MSTYEISKSSLLSLKAEILRKQQELGKVKAQNDVKIRNLRNSVPLGLKNKGVEQRQVKDNVEEENLLKKSRDTLEAKSKLYDQLSKNSKNWTDEDIEENRRYLVLFNRKSKDLPPDDDEDDVDKYPEEEEEIMDDYEPAKSYDEEWVEYVDCLGRTRTCMRKDINYLKSKDKDLRRAESRLRDDAKPSHEKPSPPKEDKSKDVPPIDVNLTEENDLLSNDMRREILRRQWEKEEEELRDKSNIHYQDILFEEARTHGVGYYAFSKDEQVRIKQQEALKKLRDETKQQQEKSQNLKTMREKQLAARMKAARNRKRARMGLPPEEDEPEVETKEATTEVDVKEKEKELSKDSKQEELNKQLEEARKNHVRPWDIGKKGVKKPHYEYTQEDWVDKQRRERKGEFAPPSSYKRRSRKESSDSSSEDSDRDKSKERNSSSRKDDNRYHTNTYKNISTTKITPTPIINECSDDEEGGVSHSKTMPRGSGVEIAPPPTFDYYGPDTKKPKLLHNSTNISESIDAGLRFLRKQIEQKESRSSRNAEDMFAE